MADGTFEDPLASRLQRLVDRGRALIAEGLPFPVQQVQDLVEQFRSRGEGPRAEQALNRAERLLDRANADWQLLREQLRRLEELEELARKCGLDVNELGARIGDPRELLRRGRLSEGLLEQASGMCSKSLAVLVGLLPQFLVPESQKLARTIRAARDRGEEVGEASERLGQFVRTMRSGQLRGAAIAYLELRRSVAQIPREPTLPLPPRDEEEEILREARNLARRLNRIKTRARDAPSAARLMSEVRAALSEDRRFSTPEEEIEELWNEVDRLTRERLEAKETGPAEAKEPELDTADIPPELLEAANEPLSDLQARTIARRGRKPGRNP
ncbi:MAG: hypothetical protein L3J72_04350 [Thermoplasmata archaeon]|nr:hypothetical protein [Thermoplasmata archaeon]